MVSAVWILIGRVGIVADKFPYMQFFTGDWLKDPALTLCAPATRGVWIDLLSAMHEAGRSGELCGTAEQLARFARCSTADLALALTDLRTNKAADVEFFGDTIRVRNRRMYRESSQVRRSKKYREKVGGNPLRWIWIRARILDRDRRICAYCGNPANSVDHIVPRIRGGDESDANLVAACGLCNSRKQGRTPAEAGMEIIYAAR